ncbi:hypothetical protein ACL02O_29740 [Micromonospora sp. MS34]|uniref:hypothetical protein n=1 Tax=Micromonospora sp. MS34 TaxID=3385971 RepID=UPI0039A3245D
MGTTEVVLAEPDSIRPEVLIPPAPLGGPARWLRRLTVGPGRSSLDRARTVTLGWLTAAVLAVIIDRMLVDHVLVTLAGGTLVGYTVVRAAALWIVERRQYAFERCWLDEQSRLLRRHPFEVVSVRVQVSVDQTRSTVRGVDLTNPADVAWLLDQQAAAGADGAAQARVEFGYWATGGSGRSSDTVRRRLADLQVRPVGTAITRARIRFPQARYVAVGATAGASGCWPDPVAHWSLVGPVQLTTTRVA